MGAGKFVQRRERSEVENVRGEGYGRAMKVKMNDKAEHASPKINHEVSVRQPHSA